MLVAQRAQRLRDAILSAQLLVQAGHRGDARRRRPGTVEPCRDAVVRELRLVDARRRDRFRTAPTRAVRVDRHVDDDREPVRSC